MNIIGRDGRSFLLELEEGVARVLDLHGRPLLTQERPLRVIASSRPWRAYVDVDGRVAALAEAILARGERVGGTPERPLLAAPLASADPASLAPNPAGHPSAQPAELIVSHRSA